MCPTLNGCPVTEQQVQDFEGRDSLICGAKGYLDVQRQHNIQDDLLCLSQEDSA